MGGAVELGSDGVTYGAAVPGLGAVLAGNSLAVTDGEASSALARVWPDEAVSMWFDQARNGVA
jgi:hypothetical protein